MITCVQNRLLFVPLLVIARGAFAVMNTRAIRIAVRISKITRMVLRIFELFSIEDIVSCLGYNGHA